MRSTTSASALLAIMLLGGSLSAQTSLIVTLTDDTYNYGSVPDGGGTRQFANTFAYLPPPPPAPVFPFDAHSAMMLAKWNVQIPAAIDGQPFDVVSARITVYNTINASWDPAAGEVRLFAVDFLPSTFTVATWNESIPFTGPDNFNFAPRNPFVRDLNTNANVQRDLTGTPWAVGVVDPSFDGTPATSAAPFSITFNLDVSNPTIKNEITNQILNGESMWAIASTYLVTGFGPGPITYPRILTKEGVLVPANLATAAMAPRLEIEVEAYSHAQDWHHY